MATVSIEMRKARVEVVCAAIRVAKAQEKVIDKKLFIPQIMSKFCVSRRTANEYLAQAFVDADRTHEDEYSL